MCPEYRILLKLEIQAFCELPNMVLGSQTASALNLQAISPAPSLEQATMIPPPKG